MSENNLVLTTAGSREEAHHIARALIERNLAACVNIIPGIESIYRWREKIEHSHEWLLLVKTTGSAFERVRDAIIELNSYELPECICVKIENGSAGYLKWLADSVKE